MVSHVTLNPDPSPVGHVLTRPRTNFTEVYIRTHTHCRSFSHLGTPFGARKQLFTTFARAHLPAGWLAAVRAHREAPAELEAGLADQILLSDPGLRRTKEGQLGCDAYQNEQKLEDEAAALLPLPSLAFGQIAATPSRGAVKPLAAAMKDGVHAALRAPQLGERRRFGEGIAVARPERLAKCGERGV